MKYTIFYEDMLTRMDAMLLFGSVQMHDSLTEPTKVIVWLGQSPNIIGDLETYCIRLTKEYISHLIFKEPK